MPASTLPGTVPEPSGTWPDRTPPGPAPAGKVTAPPPASGPPAEWPEDVHLPDEGEDDEC